MPQKASFQLTYQEYIEITGRFIFNGEHNFTHSVFGMEAQPLPDENSGKHLIYFHYWFCGTQHSQYIEQNQKTCDPF